MAVWLDDCFYVGIPGGVPLPLLVFVNHGGVPAVWMLIPPTYDVHKPCSVAPTVQATFIKRPPEHEPPFYISHLCSSFLKISLLLSTSSLQESHDISLIVIYVAIFLRQPHDTRCWPQREDQESQGTCGHCLKDLPRQDMRS